MSAAPALLRDVLGTTRAHAGVPWPGLDPLEASRAVFEELGGEHGLPSLPVLAIRGPGADPVGRTAALLVDVPVDLQPVGWRLTDHPGRDLHRAQGFLRADTDALAEAADGYAGPLALSCTGPWSLAASLWLPRGERAAVDPGAARDLAASLAQGLSDHVAHVRRLVPGARPVVVLDEGDVGAVLAGRVPRASGWGRLPPVGLVVVREGLRTVLDALADAGAATVVRVPLVRSDDGPAPTARALLAAVREAGAGGAALSWSQVAAVGEPAWEAVAETAEAGLPLVVALDPDEPSALVAAVTQPWRRLGLDPALLDRTVLSPRSVAPTPAAAVATLARLRAGAQALADTAAGG